MSSDDNFRNVFLFEKIREKTGSIEIQELNESVSWYNNFIIYLNGKAKS